MRGAAKRHASSLRTWIEMKTFHLLVPGTELTAVEGFLRECERAAIV